MFRAGFPNPGVDTSFAKHGSVRYSQTVLCTPLYRSTFGTPIYTLYDPPVIYAYDMFKDCAENCGLRESVGLKISTLIMSFVMLLTSSMDDKGSIMIMLTCCLNTTKDLGSFCYLSFIRVSVDRATTIFAVLFVAFSPESATMDIDTWVGNVHTTSVGLEETQGSYEVFLPAP